MARLSVKAGDRWACFSTVSDMFITPFMSVEDYEKWRETEYGRLVEPMEYIVPTPLDEALFSLSLNKTDEQIMENMRFAGLFAERDDEDNE